MGRKWVICFTLVAAVFLAFLPVSHNDFVGYDDNILIYENPMVLRGLGLETVSWAFTSIGQANWSPVPRLGHLLNVSFFGLRPGAHHLVSVLYHSLAAVILFLALRRLTGMLWPPAFAAGLFALHPLRVESVAWAAELKDPLSGLFLGLTLLAYAVYARGPTLLRYLAVAAAFAAGLMDKATLVPLPFLLLLIDFWPLGRSGWRCVVEKIPLLLMSAGSSIVMYHTAEHSHALWNILAMFSLPIRIENAMVSVYSYLGKFLWPTGLAVFYPHPGHGIPARKAAAAAVVLLAVTLFVLRHLQRRPYLAVGWFWCLGMLVPVLGLVQPGLHGMADRFTYLPLIGLAIALVWGARDIVARSRFPGWLVPAAAGSLLVVCGMMTWIQCGYWRTMETLFRHAVSVTERNWVALSNLAVALSAAQRQDEAIALHRRALEIQPNGFTYLMLGNILRERSLLSEAIDCYRNALRWTPKKAEVYNNLGGALVQAGRLAEGAEQFRTALRLEPGYPPAAKNLKTVGDLMNKAQGKTR